MKELMNLPSIIIIIFVLLTYLHALLKLRTKKVINKYLLYILSLSVFVELINGYLKYKGITNDTFTSLTIIISSILWFLILYMIFNSKKLIIFTIVLFSIFAIINFFFMEGPLQFNYYTLIFGAFLYILFFLFESFNQLKNDNLYFFQSNKYILIASPIILFLGLTLLFFLKNYFLSTNSILENVKLFTYFNIFVNVSFYLSLNYYILKEKK